MKPAPGGSRESPAPMQRPPAGGANPCTLPCYVSNATCPSLQIPAGAFHPGWDGGPGCCWATRGGDKDCYPTQRPTPAGTHVESTHEHPAGPFQAGFVQEGVERGRTWLRDLHAKDSSKCRGRSSRARTSWSGLGPATPTWHTGIVGQAGDAPKRHLNPGDVLECIPQEQAAGLGGHEELGGRERRGQSGRTVPQSRAHATMPRSHSDGCSTSRPPRVPNSVGMG